MKITYIAKSIVPSRAASSVHIMKMCQALALNGHQVELCVPNTVNNKNLHLKDIYTFYGVKPCFSISFIPWLPIKGKGYIYEWLAARHAQKNHSDIVYGREIVACYFACRKSLPVVFESHFPVSDLGKIKSWLFQRLLKSSYFKYLVVITNSLRQWYLNTYDLSDSQILVFPDGADIPKETFQKTAFPNHYSKEHFKVGYFGHLYPGKGMEIISELVKRCPDIEFHIYGGLDQDINYWSNYLSNYTNITFHGYYPHSEIQTQMKKMDVLVCPSLKNIKVFDKDNLDIGKWTSPLKIFEYMASMKPIIASNIEVLKEILENERNAILCNPNDLEEWKMALYQIKNNPTLSKQISDNAYKDLNLKYSWNMRAKQLSEYLTNTIH